MQQACESQTLNVVLTADDFLFECVFIKNKLFTDKPFQMHHNLVIICNGFSILANLSTQELKVGSSLMAKIAFSYNNNHKGSSMFL